MKVMMLIACLLAVAVVVVDAAKPSTLASVSSVSCEATVYADLQSAKAALQEKVDAENAVIDECAVAIGANQDVMDGKSKTIAASRLALRTQNVALESLSSTYADKVDDFKTRLVEYRDLFALCKTSTGSSAAKAKLLASPLRKLLVKAKSESYSKALSRLAAEPLFSYTATVTVGQNLDNELTTNEDQLANEGSDSSLLSIDDVLGSSDLGSDSTVADTSDTTVGLFKQLLNAIRLDVSSLKTTHETAQSAYISGRSAIVTEITSCKTAITDAAAANAKLAVTNAELQAKIVAAIATGSALEDQIALNLKEQAAWLRRCS